MKRIVVMLGMVALIAPRVAHADAGIGWLMLPFFYIVVALVPTILIEAFVLRRMLAAGFARALRVSAAANIVSTIAGFVLGVLSSFLGGIEGGREPTLAALVPLFFATWLIEYLVVRGMQRDAPRVGRATFVANVLTYGLLAAAVAIYTAPYGHYFTRTKLSEPLNAMSMVKKQVAEQFAASGRFPASVGDIPRTPGLRGIVIEPQGRIVGELHFPASPQMDGKHLVYEPRVENGRIVEWRCHSPDAAAKYLPASCR